MELKAEPLPQGCYDSSANVSMKNLVAIPFSRGPSWPRDGTQVSFIAGMFFTTVLPGKSQVHSFRPNRLRFCNLSSSCVTHLDLLLWEIEQN